MTTAMELCECAGEPPVKLMTALSTDPVHCVACNLIVPLERLDLDDVLHDELRRWGALMASIDHLWLDSGDYELWALRELSDAESSINRRGLDLRSRLEAGREAYYWFFQDESVDDFHPIDRCPSCRRALREYGGEGLFRQLVCEDCRILTAG
jgi:predicted  nucleic acid-binding Zn ribbon protein